eukprot:bmy_14266T0
MAFGKCLSSCTEGNSVYLFEESTEARVHSSATERRARFSFVKEVPQKLCSQPESGRTPRTSVKRAEVGPWRAGGRARTQRKRLSGVWCCRGARPRGGLGRGLGSRSYPSWVPESNAYTTTAINGTDFCTSAKDALKLLSKNSSHFTSVNCFGDFVIFLGKWHADIRVHLYGYPSAVRAPEGLQFVLVVCFTVFGGLMAFNYHRVLQVWAIPLLLVAFFAYLVAHSFLSMFETVLDALFLCFAVDLETNDGSSEKPYFMDQEFLDQQIKQCKGTERQELINE